MLYSNRSSLDTKYMLSFDGLDGNMDNPCAFISALCYPEDFQCRQSCTLFYIFQLSFSLLNHSGRLVSRVFPVIMSARRNACRIAWSKICWYHILVKNRRIPGYITVINSLKLFSRTVFHLFLHLQYSELLMSNCQCFMRAISSRMRKSVFHSNNAGTTTYIMSRDERCTNTLCGLR